MPEKLHAVEAQWRETEAAALYEKVRAIKDWLEHTEDLQAMFALDEEAVKELRSVSGLVRMRRDDLSHKADLIKAELAK